MSNNTDSEMIACAQTLRAAVNNETEITVTRRITISNIYPAVRTDYVIFFGDIHNKATWKWECAQGETLEQAQSAALTQIAAQGNERKRELQRLQEAAGKLGLQLVEATK